MNLESICTNMSKKDFFKQKEMERKNKTQQETKADNAKSFSEIYGSPKNVDPERENRETEIEPATNEDVNNVSGGFISNLNEVVHHPADKNVIFEFAKKLSEKQRPWCQTNIDLQTKEITIVCRFTGNESDLEELIKIGDML